METRFCNALFSSFVSKRYGIPSIYTTKVDKMVDGWCKGTVCKAPERHKHLYVYPAYMLKKNVPVTKVWPKTSQTDMLNG